MEGAVLLVLNYRESGLTILLTKRSENLTHHKGQVAFPGGLIETTDSSLLKTALRETQEEIGLDPEAIEILGELPKIATGSSLVLVTPFVAWGENLSNFKPNPREIEKIFEIPFKFLKQPNLFQKQLWNDGSQDHYLYFFDYQGERVWGATAAILKEFMDLLEDQGIF
jgi:8-oxo-dGTP pyrophosphatase MutT (NUDIX family)